MTDFVVTGLNCSNSISVNHTSSLLAAGLVGLDQRSYSTLGLVSAWVGDRLWTGKPPRFRTRHPGLLSLGPTSVAGWNEYAAKAGEVNMHIA